MDSGKSNVEGRQAKRRAAQMMKRIIVHFRSQLDERLRPHGVTTAQLQIMKAVSQEPGLSGAKLARICHITPQSVQTLLKGLEEGGWIVRSKDRGNDRVLNTELTGAGKALLVKAEREVRVIERRLWRGVSESSIATFNDVLAQCLANIERRPDGNQASIENGG